MPNIHPPSLMTIMPNTADDNQLPKNRYDLRQGTIAADMIKGHDLSACQHESNDSIPDSGDVTFKVAPPSQHAGLYGRPTNRWLYKGRSRLEDHCLLEKLTAACKPRTMDLQQHRLCADEA